MSTSREPVAGPSILELTDRSFQNSESIDRALTVKSQDFLGFASDFLMKWFEKLVKTREQAKLKQNELAKLIGIQPSQLSRWERGEGTPSMFQIADLAKHLNVNVDYLIYDDQEQKEPLVAYYETKQQTPEDLAIASLVQSLGPKEALRRLTFTSAVEVLPNPELQEVLLSQDVTSGPIRLNANGMLEVGAFVVGKTTRVLFKTTKQLRRLAIDLASLSMELDQTEKLNELKRSEMDALMKEFKRLRKQLTDGVIDHETLKHSMDAFYKQQEATISENFSGYGVSYEPDTEPFDISLFENGDGPKKRVS